MADHSLPTTISTYTNFVSQLSARFNDLAMMLDPAVTTATNVPVNAVRWNSSSNRFEKWNGSAWNALSSTFAFTDITASGNVTLSGGTANGVPYLNSSKVLTTGSALTFDGANLGVGVVPSAANNTLLQGQDNFTVGSAGPSINVASNAYWNAGWKYATNNPATMHRQAAGVNYWYNAPSGTAGNTISFTQAMTLDSSGNLLVGTTNASAKLTVSNPNDALKPTAYFNQNYGVTGQPITAIRLNLNDAAGGMYLHGYGNDAAISHNAEYLAALGWTARNSFASRLEQNNGAFAWYSNTGLTAGSVFTPTERMRLDASGNLGLGVTPSAWGSARRVLQVGTAAIAQAPAGNDVFELSANRYLNSGLSDTYIGAGYATAYQQNAGAHKWFTAPSGTAGAAISFTQAMTLDASGNLGIGTTSPGFKLDVLGPGNVGGVNNDLTARILSANSAAGLGLNFNSIWSIGTGQPLIFGTASIERARIDSSGNLGLGVTPSAWGSSYKAMQIGSAGGLSLVGSPVIASADVGNNFYYDGSNYRYVANAAAARMYFYDGATTWYATTASGTAGALISFTQTMALSRYGDLSVSGNLSVNGTVADSTATLRPLVSGALQATTSGTSKDFTGIPSWVKRITMMLNQVSLSGSSNPRFRLGTSGGFATSGYVAYTNVIQNSTVVASATAGFDTNGSSSTTTTYSGIVTFTLMDAANNVWVASGLLAMAGSVSQTAFSGMVALSGTLTQVRLTSTNGTDTFDAGSVNILYE